MEVPVVVMIHEGGYGVTKDEIDWNGNGDFTTGSEVEKIVGPVDFFESGTKTLTLMVPPDLKFPGRSLHASGWGGKQGKLYGPRNAQNGGEVEDYLLQSKEKRGSGSNADRVLPTRNLGN